MTSILCPYCKVFANLLTGDKVYNNCNANYKNYYFWVCPFCNARVGCHRPNRKLGHDGTEPLGTLANAQLRFERSRAHKVLDTLWESDHERTLIYKTLALRMSIGQENCHIALFNSEQCKIALTILNSLIQLPERQNLNRSFNQKRKREKQWHKAKKRVRKQLIIRGNKNG